MHIVLAIVGLIGAGAFWWYRIKYMSEAVGEAADAAGRVQGHFRRNKLRKKSALAPISSIDAPIVAAATIMVAIAAEDSVFSPDLEKGVREQLLTIESEGKVDEAIHYANWAASQVAEVSHVIDIAGKFLATRLDENEKRDLLSMVADAIPPGKRHQAFHERIKQLRHKLRLAPSVR
jgi:hypothetical protein